MKNLALVICTKDRPNHMANLKDNLLSQKVLPNFIVIVDSSFNDETEKLVTDSDLKLKTKLVYVKSVPGLPIQRNIGVKIVFENSKDTKFEVVSFIDDDIELASDYFYNLMADLENLGNFVAITGTTYFPNPDRISVFDQFFLIKSKIQGKVLKSGQTSQPFSEVGVCVTEWMPGLSMNINPKFLEIEKFEESIRMYGEDLEFSLRLRKYGPLYCSANLRYSHRNAPEGREDVYKVTAFTDGIRWTLAKSNPETIERIAVIWAIFGLLLLDLIKLFTFRNIRPRFQRMLGHTLFINRLLLGLNPLQNINRS
jgi:GT2 family glycosyltransferase